jgi:hypothetical protein
MDVPNKMLDLAAQMDPSRLQFQYDLSPTWLRWYDIKIKEYICVGIEISDDEILIGHQVSNNSRRVFYRSCQIANQLFLFVKEHFMSDPKYRIRIITGDYLYCHEQIKKNQRISKHNFLFGYKEWSTTFYEHAHWYFLGLALLLGTFSSTLAAIFHVLATSQNPWLLIPLFVFTPGTIMVELFVFALLWHLISECIKDVFLIKRYINY